MDNKHAIKTLEGILRQFEYSITEAENGIDDAIEALEDNKECVDALNIAIKALKSRKVKN